MQIGNNSGNLETRTVKMRYNCPAKIRLLYITDLHFNKHSQQRAGELARIIKGQNPDILLFGGDYVDSHRGIQPLREVLAAAQSQPLALAVAGNHDYFFGLGKMKALMAEYGIRWLERQSVQLEVNGQAIRIDGKRITTEPPSDELQILCLHEPLAPPKPDNPYDLILAGHLHGCQFVFWESPKGLYPGRWFYRWNILEKHLGHCRYVVSRGVGDTLALRYNCAREVVVVEISSGG